MCDPITMKSDSAMKPAMSQQMRYYYNLTDEQRQQRKQRILEWRAKQDPERLKAVAQAWREKKLQEDPDYFRRVNLASYHRRKAADPEKMRTQAREYYLRARNKSARV